MFKCDKNKEEKKDYSNKSLNKVFYKNSSSQYFPLIMLLTATGLLLIAYFLRQCTVKPEHKITSELSKTREFEKKDSTSIVSHLDNVIQ